MNAFEKIMEDCKVWFTCYEDTTKKEWFGRKNILCQGPFDTVLEADKATPDNVKNSTLLPVFFLFPHIGLDKYMLHAKYKTLFMPSYNFSLQK
jgi:hypothetical protein